jgi:hypothetical protein
VGKSGVPFRLVSKAEAQIISQAFSFNAAGKLVIFTLQLVRNCNRPLLNGGVVSALGI